VGLVKNLKTLFKKELLIPQNPQVIGAIGAALIAQERSQ
jgi:activator of 2-hydroxyglutaryl-CoA dehydratase